MTASPKRTIRDNIITSPAQPAIKLHIADSFTYVGRLKFIIKQVAEAEVFIFVSADSDKKIDRILIVQFEGWLDDNAYTYNYPVRHTVILGEHEYVHDTFVYPSALDDAEPESDSAQTRNFIAQQGYTLPTEVISCRFIRALDTTRRTEILFSYAEDLSAYGFHVRDISHEYRPTPDYSYLEGEMLERALQAFTIIEG